MKIDIHQSATTIYHIVNITSKDGLTREYEVEEYHMVEVFKALPDLFSKFKDDTEVHRQRAVRLGRTDAGEFYETRAPIE